MVEAEETAETDWIGHAGEKHPWLSANILVVEEAERKGQTKVECKEGPRTSCLTLFKKGKQQRCLQHQNISGNFGSGNFGSGNFGGRNFGRKFGRRKFGKQHPVEREQVPGVAVPTARGRAVSPDPLSPVTFIKWLFLRGIRSSDRGLQRGDGHETAGSQKVRRRAHLRCYDNIMGTYDLPMGINTFFTRSSIALRPCLYHFVTIALQE